MMTKACNIPMLAEILHVVFAQQDKPDLRCPQRKYLHMQVARPESLVIRQKQFSGTPSRYLEQYLLLSLADGLVRGRCPSVLRFS